MSSSIKFICSSFSCCADFVDLSLSVHFKNTFILEFKMLIFCSLLVNFIDLLSSPIKFMLRFSRSFRDCVLNEKDKCLLGFFFSCSVNDIFNHKDFPFIYSQLLILSKFLCQVCCIFYRLLEQPLRCLVLYRLQIFVLCHLLLMTETKYQ